MDNMLISVMMTCTFQGERGDSSRFILKGNNHRDYEYVTAQIDELTKISDTFDIDAIKKKLKEIVPEYTPQF
jgi:hypothetical protein